MGTPLRIEKLDLGMPHKHTDCALFHTWSNFRFHWVQRRFLEATKQMLEYRAHTDFTVWMVRTSKLRSNSPISQCIGYTPAVSKKKKTKRKLCSNLPHSEPKALALPQLHIWVAIIEHLVSARRPLLRSLCNQSANVTLRCPSCKLFRIQKNVGKKTLDHILIGWNPSTDH